MTGIDDLSRCLAALDENRTLVAVIELSGIVNLSNAGTQ